MSTLRKMIDGDSHDATKEMIDKVGDVEEKKMQYDVAREKLRTHLLPTRAVTEHLTQRHMLDDQQDPNGMQQNQNQQMPGRGMQQQQPGGQMRPGMPVGQTKMQPRNPGGPAQRPNPAKSAGGGRAKPAAKKSGGKGIDIRVKASENMERAIQLHSGGPGSGRHPEYGKFKKTGHDMTPLKTGQYQGYYNGMKTTYESPKGTTVEMHDHAFRGTTGTVRFKENGKTVKEVPRHEAGKFAHQHYGIRYKAVKP